MNKQIDERCPCQTDAHSCCACVSMKCHECHKPMQSKFVLGRFCSNCGRPLKADVQRIYRKSTDVAREIFEELETVLCYKMHPVVDRNGFIHTIKSNDMRIRLEDFHAIKKKYESEGAE